VKFFVETILGLNNKKKGKNHNNNKIKVCWSFWKLG